MTSAIEVQRRLGLPTYYADSDALLPLASEGHPSYVSASPFPHAVWDDFFPADFLDEVVAEFPDRDGIPWKFFQHDNSAKRGCGDESLMGPFTRHLLAQLNGQAFVRFLETLTGIEGLIPDPNLEGGGLHRIDPGGRLEIHADFNRHKHLRLDRRLNFLVFLNKDWREEYGGHLELWDRSMSQCEVRLLPVYNRAVLFSTTDQSFHGHPHPLECPEGRARCSLALYYYANGRPKHERSPTHSTLYQRRPGQPRRPSKLVKRLRRLVSRPPGS